jgi:flagellar motor protein MotB
VLWRRKKNGAAAGLPSWIVSYGDMITTLLCFFIVLSALAKDQTGLKLHAGLESFKKRPLFRGLAGLSKKSAQMAPFDLPSPDMIPEAIVQQEKDNQLVGAEQENGKARIIDLEEEHFQRFLGKLDRQFELAKTAKVLGQTTIDVYEPRTGQPPQAGPQGQKAI